MKVACRAPPVHCNSASWNGESHKGDKKLRYWIYYSETYFWDVFSLGWPLNVELLLGILGGSMFLRFSKLEASVKTFDNNWLILGHNWDNKGIHEISKELTIMHYF